MNAFNPEFPGPSLPDFGTLALIVALVAAAPLLLRPIGRMFGLTGYQSGALAVALVAGVAFLVRTFGIGLPTFHSVVLALALLLALPFVPLVTDGLGRRLTIIVASVVMILGAVLQTCARNCETLPN